MVTLQQETVVTTVKTKIEQVDFEFAMNREEKKRLTGQKFTSPKRECEFCGRITNHSLNGKVCLVCGLVNEIH